MEHEPKIGNEEVLSQLEVEQLLADVAEQDNSLLVYGHKAKPVRRPSESVQAFDFRNPMFLSARELRRLRLLHEDYLRSLSARLSIFLRLEFSLQMAQLQTLPYGKFIENLGTPTHLTLFKVEPLRGICLLEIQPRLGLTVVDRLMGGPAHSVNQEHDLSEIEMALLDQACQVMLSEWCCHWTDIQEVRASIIGHENNGQFVQAAAEDTVLLVLTMEARFGDCMEHIQLAFPYYTLEPLVRGLNQKMPRMEEDHVPAEKSAKLAWNPALDKMKVLLAAQWEGLQMTARDLASLKVGDVLQLEPQALSQVQVSLAGVPKYTAQLGQVGAKWALELNDPATGRKRS